MPNSMFSWSASSACPATKSSPWAQSRAAAHVLNESIVHELRISPAAIEAATDSELREIQRREREYRDDRPPVELAGRDVILVDDGLATGASMRAAAVAARRLDPHRLIIAVPVAAAETCNELHSFADEVICAATPQPFYAVGLWYHEFGPTSDSEVRLLLAESDHAREHAHSSRGNAQ